MKKQLFTLSLLCMGSLAFAQNVGIGTAAPDASAKLDISSSNSGILIPRIALNNVTDGLAPVASPVLGVLVFNTNAAVTGGTGTGFYYWNGTAWAKLQDASQSNDWTLTGNGSTNPATNFIGTTDAVDFVTRTGNTERMRVLSGGNVGIGTATPNAKFEVNGPTGDENTSGIIRATSPSSTSNLRMGVVDNNRAWIQSHGSVPLYLNTLGNNLVLNLNAGNTGVGVVPGNKMDINNGTRSGIHATNRPLYVTGALGANNNGVEFRHENGSQGIGFGFNTIYATGSNANQDLGLASLGTGNLNFSTNGAQRMIIMGSNGRVGVGTTTPAYTLDLNTGTFGFGSANVRTETRDNAGLQGNAGAQSGFFETSNPTNYPAGASSWWHLIDSRHSNNTNNFALQIAGSFFDQELWFRKTNDNAAQAWSRLISTSNLNTLAWALTGNSGTNPATNFIGTTDGNAFSVRTNNAERIRVSATGAVNIWSGVNYAVPNNYMTGGSLTIGSTTSNYGGGASWNANTAGLLFETLDNTELAIHDSGTRLASFMYYEGAANRFNIGRDMGWGTISTISMNGNVGIGTTTPAARLQVVNGAIMPQTGNTAASGIYFPTNPGGGGGDEAYIRHYIEAGEDTKLVIANLNDPDDDVSIRTGLGGGYERIQVNGNGTTYINRSVLFNCNDCGHTGVYDLGDGAGSDWGDLVVQGRVLSTNSNLHLSPPGGNRVIINSAYRAAGGGGGQVGLDVDGGIRMRKNYRWINRYGSTGGYGWGSQLHNLGTWDFCAVGHVGFRNTNSWDDEDDDVQCAVYPNAHADYNEGSLWDSWFTYQYYERPNWYMYLEGYADTNATNCAASCINFD